MLALILCTLIAAIAGAILGKRQAGYGEDVFLNTLTTVIVLDLLAFGVLFLVSVPGDVQLDGGLVLFGYLAADVAFVLTAEIARGVLTSRMEAQCVPSDDGAI